MNANQRRSVIGIYKIPTGSMNSGDRMQTIPLYRMLGTILGWSGKIINIASSGISQINGISLSAISKVNGV